MNNARQRCRNYSFLMVLLVFFTCFFQIKDRYTYPLNDEELVMVDTLLEKPQTRYFGLYSIELSSDFTSSENGITFNGTDMSVIGSKRQFYPAFKQFLYRHEEKLRNTHPVDKIDEPYLKNVYPLSSSEFGVIFEHTKNRFVSDAARVLNAWKWEGNVTFSVQINARDQRASRYDKYKEVTPELFIYTIPKKKEDLLLILSNLHPREENRAPLGGRIAINFGEIDPEVLGLYDLIVQYVNSKLISIRLRTDNQVDVGVPLLKQDVRVVESNDGRTIYKKERKINGLDSSEWLLKRSGGYGSGSYFFMNLIWF